MKIARFSNDLEKKLKKCAMTINPYSYNDFDNSLLLAFVPEDKWDKIKKLEIGCMETFKPHVGTVVIGRIDDGHLPIYLELGNNCILITGEADYIEWSLTENFFSYTTCVEEIEFRDIDMRTAVVTEGMFSCNIGLTEIHFSNIIGNITSTSSMFAGCQSIEEIDMSAFKDLEPQTTKEMFKWCRCLKRVKGLKIGKNCSDMSKMFELCRSLEEIDMSEWNVDSVISMNGLFLNCRKLKQIDMSSWNPQILEDSSSMFEGCEQLTHNAVLPVEGWSLWELKKTQSMFARCLCLESIDLSKWRTRDIRDMSYMFSNCISIRSINLHGWKTTRASNMKSMFSGCKELEGLDISTLRTSSVSNMDGMFKDCKALRSLDVSHFALGKCKHMQGMFEDCSSLVSIDISGWKINASIDTCNCFKGCDSLVLVDEAVFNKMNKNCR